VDWIKLAEKRVQCWVLVNMVINIKVPYKAESKLVS
jgi:hypothetical protein